jgi:GNAT superfamily N-acetyltransferase
MAIAHLGQSAQGTAVVKLRAGKASDLPELLSWLKEERDQTGEGFYCNKTVIERCFERGDVLCAINDGRILGFAALQFYGESGAIHMVEAHPSERRRRIGSALLKAAVDMLRGRGALCVDVECSTPQGEALCRKHGFEPYVDDPRNAPADNPTLRLYLSDRRPPVRCPWA